VPASAIVMDGSEFIEFPRAALDGSVPARFEAVASRCAERVAVRSRGQVLTYAALDQEATRIARAILGRGLPVAEPVALLVDHDAAAVAAILGMLKTGRPCVVLDARQPPAHLARILDDARAPLIVHGEGHAALARDVAGAARALLDSRATPPVGAEAPPGMAISPRSLAYLTYTSGSTGAPKGVVIDHRNLLHRAFSHVNSVRIMAGDRLSLVHGLSVAASYRQLWGALLVGASVSLFDLAADGPGPIPDWLRDQMITICHFPASAFRHFAASLGEGETFPTVRAVILANEPVFPSDVLLFRRHFPPAAVFFNSVGITETGTILQHAVDSRTPLSGTLLPVGRPVPDKEILLLDEKGEPVGDSEIGEIAVRSEFLAGGYWRRPDLDAKAFLPDGEGGDKRLYRTGDLGRSLPDGSLVYLGRKDVQPKLRGRFVDTLEVEARLLAHPDVAGVAVAVREDRPGEQRLVAYVVPATGSGPSVSEIRRFLRTALPAHMVPSALVLLDELPRTPNGKIDRRALPVPGRSRPTVDRSFVAPATPVERTLARLWAEVLDLDEIGTDDDFLDLGGHSLLAARILSRIHDELGVHVPLAQFLEAATVARLATVLVVEMVKGVEPGVQASLVDGTRDDHARP
jgi:amino acid adenylation domain-containing protein